VTTEADAAELQTKAALFASTALLALVGDQITPDEIPEEVTPAMLPAIAYERGNTEPEYTLDNTLAASRVSMVVTIWALSRKQANEVAVAVTNAMHDAGHAQTDREVAYEPELRQHAAILTFDVWELNP